MKKYRKKPVEITAVKFEYPPSEDFMKFLGDAAGNLRKSRHAGALAELEIRTMEDGIDNRCKHVATEGDYIIRGVQGEFYPCKPDIFNATYEPV